MVSGLPSERDEKDETTARWAERDVAAIVIVLMGFCWLAGALTLLPWIILQLAKAEVAGSWASLPSMLVTFALSALLAFVFLRYHDSISTALFARMPADLSRNRISAGTRAAALAFWLRALCAYSLINAAFPIIENSLRTMRYATHGLTLAYNLVSLSQSLLVGLLALYFVRYPRSLLKFTRFQ